MMAIALCGACRVGAVLFKYGETAENHAGMGVAPMHEPAAGSRIGATPIPAWFSAVSPYLNSTAPTLQAPQSAIAIIGVAGRYPQARDLHAFWENLRNGRDCITGIPD